MIFLSADIFVYFYVYVVLSAWDPEQGEEESSKEIRREGGTDAQRTTVTLESIYQTSSTDLAEKLVEVTCVAH